MRLAGENNILNELYISTLGFLPRKCRTCGKQFTNKNVNKVLYCVECWAHECASCARNTDFVFKAEKCAVCGELAPYWFADVKNDVHVRIFYANMWKQYM